MHLSGASRVRAERVPYCFVTPASPTSPNYRSGRAAPAQRSAPQRPNLRSPRPRVHDDDPSAVDVLYGMPERGEALDALQALWRELVTRLEDAGLLEADQQRVDLSGGLKAHATLLNSRWRRQGGRRESFDARPRHQTHGS